MPTLYEDPADQLRHTRAIEALAKILRMAHDDVRPAYEEELQRLRDERVVADFLPVFASRRTRRRLVEARGKAATAVNKAALAAANAKPAALADAAPRQAALH